MRGHTRIQIRSLEAGGMQRAHFEALPQERHRELLARMAFLVTQGWLPYRAYHAANDGMVLDESEDDGAIPLEWDVVREVAAAWPDPARGADARPVPGVLDLARAVVGFAEATAEQPDTAEANAEALAGLCASGRMAALVLATYEAQVAARAHAPDREPAAGEDPPVEVAPDDDGWSDYDAWA